MKSKLFDNFDPDSETNKELEKDVRLFLTLTDQQRKVFVGALGKFALADTPGLMRPVLEAVQKATGRSGVEAGDVFDMLRFFLTGMVSSETRGDSARQWGDDLVELGFVSPGERPIMVRWLDSIRKKVLPRVEADLRRRRSAAGVLPSLQSMGVTVELRAVQEEWYHWDTPIERYKPQITDVVPVASIHIGVDTGWPKDFFFQADQREVQRMIDVLTAAKADCAALRKSITLQGTQS